MKVKQTDFINKWGLNILPIFFIVSMLTLSIYAHFSNKKADSEFYLISYAGKVFKVISEERGAKSVEFENGKNQYLGFRVNYNLVDIEIGDSIIKPINSMKIIVIKKDGEVFNFE